MDIPESVLKNPLAMIDYAKIKVYVEMESDLSLKSTVLTYSKPSVVTALKLLDIISDVQNGAVLLRSAEGLRLLDGLNRTVCHI